MARKYLWHTIWWLLSCAAAILVFTTQGGAQWDSRPTLSASATVRLTAFKPSSISVSVHEVPLAFDFQPSGSNPPLAIPVTTIWNVNPLEVRGVELVAYFADPEHALTTPESFLYPCSLCHGTRERQFLSPVPGKQPHRPVRQQSAFVRRSRFIRKLTRDTEPVA